MSSTNLPYASPFRKSTDTMRGLQIDKSRQHSQDNRNQTGMEVANSAWSTIITNKSNFAVLGTPKKIIATRSDVSVSTVGLENQPPTAILKVANSEQSAHHLTYQKNVLSMLRNNGRLQNWFYLPTLLAVSGENTEHTFLLESIVKGQDLRNYLPNRKMRNRLLQEAVDVIDAFHGQTADIHTVTTDTIKAWVDEPIDYIRDALDQRFLRKQLPKLERLRKQLTASLINKELPQSWVHGDYTPGNIMVKNGKITGLIDWEMARPYALPHIDYLHLVLATRTAVSGQTLSNIMCDFLKKKAYWTKEECIILSSADTPQLGDFLSGNTLLLLAWIQRISATLAKSERYANDKQWVKKNIAAVLRALPKD